ncbi:T9SS type A sorting domain-containing protein [Brumimicrobium aurantiacum]|uniref:Secretion system C-terminal sorting domain-containing protein n=1 Tax=Brumimicrobium aurantiacum TaxID=1737063 RepID=A0A3E1EXG3_9FLAO|nr:T9SS type A sorting domain-containing protein [Brumimicrobium aurantiacum]RFC54222.1 hypothetical protein DXU93_09555 [Brumimicrobium aurantiacum]
MKSFTTFIAILAFFFFNLSNLYGQSSDTINTNFNDTRFSKFDGVWHAYDSIGNSYYEINKDFISIKYEKTTTSNQIKVFEASNQLVFKRKNVLGWYDYEVNVSEDSIFNYVINLESSSLTNLVEISTKGSYLSTPNDSEHGNQWYPADSYIDVDFSIENVSNVTIAVSPVSGSGSVNNYVVNLNESTKQIDVSNLNTGWYSVTLMCDGTLKDAKLVYVN